MASLRYHPLYKEGPNKVIYLEDGGCNVLEELAEILDYDENKYNKLMDLVVRLRTDGAITNDTKNKSLHGCPKLKELKANPCRLYYVWHLECICLLHGVPKGKDGVSQQNRDVDRACKRKKTAKAIDHITT